MPFILERPILTTTERGRLEMGKRNIPTIDEKKRLQRPQIGPFATCSTDFVPFFFQLMPFILYIEANS